MVKVIQQAAEISQAVRDVAPDRIAVAYIGEGWSNYVSAKRLKEIIVSPTLGSNPRAIEELIQVLGINNVHFLDSLHAKLYLGDQSAILGSANLSRNGLSESGNLELVALVDDRDSVAELSKIYEEYKSDAIKLYSTEKAKLDRLSRLKKQTREARTQDFLDDVRCSVSRPLHACHLSFDRIHVVWYRSGEASVNEDNVRRAIHEDDLLTPEQDHHEAIQFRAGDNVQEGDWLLCWNRTESGRVRKGSKASWMYVDLVVDDGSDDAEYSKLAIQARPHSHGEEPFTIDDALNGAIVELLNSGEFPDVCAGSRIWSLDSADQEVARFLGALKERVDGDQGR